MGTNGVFISPIFLRLALGATLIWSALAVVNTKVSVSGSEGAILAKMGVTGSAQPTPAPPPPVTEPVDPQNKPRTPPPAMSELPSEVEHESRPDPDTEPDQVPPVHMVALMQLTQVPDAAPSPMVVPRVHVNAIRMHEGAFPSPRADGSVPPSTWPQAISKDKAPVYASWALTILQLVGGVLILGGLFTRLGAFLGLATTGAFVWLALLGPAIQSGNAALGFLPATGAWDVNAAGDFVHGVLLWSLLILCSCLSLLCLGGGSLSLDAALFSTRVLKTRREIAPPAG